MGVAMITKEQTKKLRELNENVVRASISLATSPGFFKRRILSKAQKAFDNYLKEIGIE